MAKTKKLAKIKDGRPTKQTPATAKKIIEILKIGGSVIEACAYAKITTPTYYTWVNSDPAFLAETDAAKHYADIAAKNVVVNKIIKDKDDTNARWWLEKRKPEEFGGGSKNGGGDDNRIQNIIVSTDEQLASRLVNLVRGFNGKTGTGETE